MSFLFGQRKTPAELLRENKRMLDKSIREKERERQGLQAQEKKLITEIKKTAKQGQMTLKSTHAMGDAMKGVTKAMGQTNKQMNLPALQRIMQEFEMQNEKMEMVTEVMGDAMDDALEGDEKEEETEELVNQVLDEIGIDIHQQLLKAPSSAVTAPATASKVAQAETTASKGGGIDNDLQARLDNLRKM